VLEARKQWRADETTRSYIQKLDSYCLVASYFFFSEGLKFPCLKLRRFSLSVCFLFLCIILVFARSSFRFWRVPSFDLNRLEFLFLIVRHKISRIIFVVLNRVF